MPPPLCLLLLLLLLLPAAAAALPLEGGLAGHHSDSGPLQEVADMKKSSLLAFLAWRSAGASQARAAPFLGRAAGEVARRQEGPPPRQASRPEPVPCKNFFWKTFSSCK